MIAALKTEMLAVMVGWFGFLPVMHLMNLFCK